MKDDTFLKCLDIFRAVSATVVCLVMSLAAGADDESKNHNPDAGDYLWDAKRNGWQVGAKLLSASNQLEPGDPAVFQFVLKNVTDKEQTVVIQQYDDTVPTLGAGNRIALNLLGSSQRRHQHVIAPGEILERRQYRITVSTEGLLPGQYHADCQPAFWMTVEGQPNRGTGIGRRVDIPFTLGNPDDTKLSGPSRTDSEEEHIHWGDPVGGLIVGMRLPNGKTEWPNDTLIEAEMFVRNVSRHTIDFEYEVPAATDWNMHVQTADGGYVRLDAVWYTGAVSRVTRRMSLKPFEQAQMFLPDDNGRVHGPRLQLLSEKTEFKPGSPKRLISAGGEYKWVAHVSIRQFAVKDLSMVIGGSTVPFKVVAAED